MPLRHITLALLLFTLFTTSPSAQFAIVCDKDGYVNVRKQPAANAVVTDRLKDQELVCSQGDGANGWSDVYYWKNGVGQYGYIHNSRLRQVDSIPGIRTLKEIKHTGGKAVYQHDSIKVEIAVKAFIPQEHKFTYDDEGYKTIVKIDGSPYKGKDGEMPGTEFKSIEVQWGKVKSAFPASWLKNMCETDASGATIYVDEKKQRIYLEMTSFSDGAGGYTVMWLWEKGEVRSRQIWVP